MLGGRQMLIFGEGEYPSSAQIGFRAKGCGGCFLGTCCFGSALPG